MHAALDVAIEAAGYEKDKPVVRNIAFQVMPGELVGLIGPNGAGKSTTIKTITGLVKHYVGAIRIGDRLIGRDDEEDEVDGKPRGKYAYMPEQPVMYEYMTLWEHLQLAAAAYAIGEDVFGERVETLLARFRLAEHRHAYPVKFSKGMQQKMMLIIGFLIEPDVYIIDEPFIGLDPRATRDLIEMLDAERARGAGILMSTHVLDTAERMCDRFVLIHEGVIVARGTLADVRREAGMPADAALFDCFHALT